MPEATATKEQAAAAALERLLDELGRVATQTEQTLDLVRGLLPHVPVPRPSLTVVQDEQREN